MMPTPKPGVRLEEPLAVGGRLLLGHLDAVGGERVAAQPRRTHAVSDPEVDRLRCLTVSLRDLGTTQNLTRGQGVDINPSLICVEQSLVIRDLRRDAEFDLG